MMAVAAPKLPKGSNVGFFAHEAAAGLAQELKRTTKRKKLVPPPVTEPNPCVVLAVDPGETSGWAIWERGRLRSYGQCDVFGSQVDFVILRACKVAEEAGLYLALVTERPFRTRFQNQTGIGAGEKIWREKAKRSHFFGSRFVRFYPATWRSRVLGKGWGNAKREKARAHEQTIAQAVAHNAGYPVRVEGDSAPAILIGHCATYSGELAKVLPKRAWKKERTV